MSRLLNIRLDEIVVGDSCLSTAEFRALLTISADSSNYILLFRDITTGDIKLYTRVGGVPNAVTLGNVGNDTDFAVAARIDATGNFAGSLNGAAVAANAAIVRPAGLSTVNLGNATGIDSSSPWQSTIASVDFRQAAVSNADLRALSV